MKISANGAFQNAKKPSGFEEYTFSDAASLARIIKKSDHCATILKDGYRNGENFISCDMLYFDCDGGMSIDDFCQHPDFKDCFFILYTSKSHQIEKDGKPACDRFHGFLPVKTITDDKKLREKLTAMMGKYSWMDVAAKDTARLLYASPNSEIIWHDGNEYQPPEPEKFQDDIPYNDTPPKQKSISKLNGVYDMLDRRSDIMKNLAECAESGMFGNDDEWVKLGMALYEDGYTESDWTALSRPEVDSTDTSARWKSFEKVRDVTGGSLLHYIRKLHPEFMIKGSMPPSPKPRIFQVKDKAKGFSTDAPTSLETDVSPDRIKEVYELITWISQDQNGNDVRKLVDGWYLVLLDNDAELANCAKHDYTVGGPTISYSNTEILKTAIRRRIRLYGVAERTITDNVVSRVYDEIIHANRFHNRVLAFTKDLQRHYPENSPGLLDDFLSYLEFQPPSDHEPWSIEHVRKMYREIFHLFFIRMHLHIQGTAMVKDGGYYGLMTNDIVPVLGGSQEIGKTTLCQWIACNREDMYVDLGSGGKSTMFGTSDTVRQVRGRMIAELGEMKIMRDSANVEAVKSFISKTKYELDVKYVEHSEPLPSTVSYIGTSNPEEYLSDVTGNRRFFPIKLLSINLPGLSKNRELSCRLHSYYATLAESVSIDGRFEQCQQSPDLREFLGAKRDEAMITYSDHGAIIDVVSAAYDKEKVENSRVDGVHKIKNHEIEKLVCDAGYKIMITKNSITSAMEGLGYIYKPAKVDGVLHRVWVKNFNDKYKKK